MNLMNMDPTIKKVVQCHEEPLETVQIPMFIDNEQYIVRQQVVKRTEIVKTFEFRKLSDRGNNNCAPQGDSIHIKPPQCCNNVNLEEILTAFRGGNAFARESGSNNLTTHQPNRFSPTFQQPTTQNVYMPQCRANIQELMQWSDGSPDKNTTTPYPLHYTTATSTSEISPQNVWKRTNKSVRLNSSRLLFPSLYCTRATNTMAKYNNDEGTKFDDDDDKNNNCKCPPMSARAQLRKKKQRNANVC